MKQKKITEYSTSLLLEELVMYEVLPRAHIKSLIRFKSVCKKWLSLITQDPLFITRQSQMRGSDGLLFASTPDFFVNVVINEDAHSGFKLDIDRHWRILSTSNGIAYGVNERARRCMIFNPITKCTVDIPFESHCNTIALVFDPSNFSFMLISEDLPLSDDIKLQDGYRLSEFGFYVFSSKTGKWRLSKSTLWLAGTLPDFDLSYVYAEQKLYWIEWRGMAWFDIDEDAAGVIPYPHEIDYEYGEENRFSDIGVTDGLLLRYSKMIDGVTHVWILRLKSKFEFEWEKIYTLVMERIFEDNWEALINPYFTTPEALSAKAILFNCQLEDAIVFKALIAFQPRMYIFYNLTARKAKMITPRENMSFLCYRAFKGSLSPLPDLPK